MLLLNVFLFFLISFKYAHSQINNCKSKETCSECIQELGCNWCINPSSSDIHCLHESENTGNWCQQKFLIDPKFSFRILENQGFSSEKGQTVQIRPQKVELKLRKGEEYALNFQYAQAENYPVDLYYIMDLSASMEEHRKKLGVLGSKLANTMKNITNNFQLGFGSFVDKVDLPFTSTVPEKLQHPCHINKPNQKEIICAAPYSFKNHMSLTEDYLRFSNEVSKASVSGNLDSPEGGLDGLMQAMVCKDLIGWRSQARHLIVFSSDAEFHIAGDGKLAGVIEPNDAKCHMVDNNYIYGLKTDYPSVGQINQVAKENNINIVFAVVKKPRVADSYKRLSQVIENSNMGTLDEKSENVIKLVVENYNKIVDSVTISSDAPKDVEVKISSNCLNPKENGCTNIHVGEVVNFTAVIKPLKCLPNSSNKRKIIIKPETLNESITIDLEILCDCNCESFPNSEKCSKSGTMKCGVCDCNSGFFGQKCECSIETSQTDDVTNCKQNVNDTKICSGLGICRCGQCQCNKRSNPEERIFGKYCDCDNFSCKRLNGKLCAGRGYCGCGGICNCEADWTGETCECPNSALACVKPDGQNLMCNGHGNCDCGKCDCFKEENQYSGKYCDECPNCDGQRCSEFRPCVECQTYKTGVYSKEDCLRNCSFFKAITVDKIYNSQDGNTKTCTFVDDGGCSFMFQYEYLDEKNFQVKAEKDKNCPGPPNVVAWVFGVIGSILLAGLLLLVMWKVLTTVHDKREYVKFENEAKNVRWHRNDNPLYREATSTFANPLYGNAKHRNNK